MRLRNKDIADKLGISTTAVSLAINHKPGVSEETRMKVMAMISQNLLDVQGNSVMTPEKPKSILVSIHKRYGVIIDDKPFFSDLIETIQQEAMKEQYVLTIAHFLPGQDKEKYEQYIRGIAPDGILILGTEMCVDDLSFYHRLHCPVVLMDACFPLCNIDAVTIDNEVSVLRAFDYAVSLGHKNIGYLKSQLPIANFDHRYDGFIKGIRQYHLEDYDHPVILLPCTVHEAYVKMKEYLSDSSIRDSLPTLFLADLDYIALGCMQALKEEGFHIPEDISLIGYDDLAICRASDPQLTTTKVNEAALGRHAFHRLMDLIQHPSSTPYTTITEISSELICRESAKVLISQEENGNAT